MIHLDTSFLIRALAHGSAEDRSLRGWLEGSDPLGISAVGWSEFLCGPVAEEDMELIARIVPDPVPFEVADAGLAASLFNRGGRRRGSLVDCMIAAVALRVDATLATSNPDDFRRFAAAGLRLATA